MPNTDSLISSCIPRCLSRSAAISGISRYGYYTGRFLGVIAGALIGVLWVLLIGVFYKWVLKDWSYSKATRIGALAFILIALMTGFMSDMFNESIGMGLRIDEDAPNGTGGQEPGAGLRLVCKGHHDHRRKCRAACRLRQSPGQQ